MSHPEVSAKCDAGAGSALVGKSLLIFDDALASIDGHWFEYDRSVVELHRPHDTSIKIVSNRALDHVAAFEEAGVDVARSVPKSIWQGDYSDASSGVASEFRVVLEQALSYASILAGELKLSRYDCVFVPGAQLADVLAWYLLAWRGAFRRVGRVVLLLRFDIRDHSGPVPRSARKLLVWKWLFAAMRKYIASGRFALVTDSSRLAEDYFSVTGVRPQVIPSPRVMEQPTRNRSLAGGDLVFATLGAARFEKGVDVFQEAIAALLRNGAADGMRFVIQWNRSVPLPNGGTYRRDPLLEKSERVTFLDKPLTSEEYNAEFERIDCMVLPYRRRVYASRISGVAVEAACADMPIIYTRDTWLEDFVEEQGVGIAVDEGSPAQLENAMRIIARDWSDFARNAQVRGEVARAKNGADEFLRVLWGNLVTRS